MFVFFRTPSELYRDLSVRTVVIPSGDKPSCVGDAPLDYAKDTSPDKVRYYYQTLVWVMVTRSILILLEPDL